MFDRQAVAIPTRHVRDLIPRHRLRLDDDVFQNLVQRVADVDAAVRIRWPVVQHIAREPLAGFLDAFIQLFLRPPGQHLRFPLRQIRLHREVGLRQIEGRFIVHRMIYLRNKRVMKCA